MALTSYAQVAQFRPARLTAAASHPVHLMALSAMAIAILVMGTLVAALTLVLGDMALLVLAVRCPPLRGRVDCLAHERARRRAAGRLASQEHAEWKYLEALVGRTRRFNPRLRDLDTLLDTFLNVALALGQARVCAEDAQVTLLPRPPAHLAPITEQRGHASRRATSAIEALRRQLETTEQLIRLNCELAIAEQCEAGVELAHDDVHEASAGATLAT